MPAAGCVVAFVGTGATKRIGFTALPTVFSSRLL
jgi:hypothetical protein